ncbi:MAG: hypothetical protein CM15mP62_22450 [Rhodospirillaceae bacterium]|nr:MAG: hypothetical protein CM15mP62_22450 [Rhodospirillaceae bacterium]
MPMKIEMIQGLSILRPALLARFVTRVWCYVITLINITRFERPRTESAFALIHQGFRLILFRLGNWHNHSDICATMAKSTRAR